MVLTGDYNVMPTELDVYKPEKWLDDALFLPEVRGSRSAKRISRHSGIHGEISPNMASRFSYP